MQPQAGTSWPGHTCWSRSTSCAKSDGLLSYTAQMRWMKPYCRSYRSRSPASSRAMQQRPSGRVITANVWQHAGRKRLQHRALLGDRSCGRTVSELAPVGRQPLWILVANVLPEGTAQQAGDALRQLPTGRAADIPLPGYRATGCGGRIQQRKLTEGEPPHPAGHSSPCARPPPRLLAFMGWYSTSLLSSWCMMVSTRDDISGGEPPPAPPPAAPPAPPLAWLPSPPLPSAPRCSASRRSISSACTTRCRLVVSYPVMHRGQNPRSGAARCDSQPPERPPAQGTLTFRLALSGTGKAGRLLRQGAQRGIQLALMLLLLLLLRRGRLPRLPASSDCECILGCVCIQERNRQLGSIS